MASQVLLECGIRRPLSQKNFTNPRCDFISKCFINPQNNRSLDVRRKEKFDEVKFPSISSTTPIVFSKRVREWTVAPKMCAKSEKVSSSSYHPLGLGGEAEEEEEEEEEERKRIEFEFDPAAPPPFTLADIKASIPKHCWVKDSWRSMSYVVRDVVAVLGLAAVAAYLNSWFFWPLYWALQGTLFWALFVLGHDCGHGSFSNNPKLNSVVGHILHSSILVPYHGWRISHRTHHQNHGHVEKDESWHPLSESLFRNLDKLTRTLRFTLPFPMLAYPFYLWTRSPGKTGSHFNPSSDLFVPSERNNVITSTVCWAVTVILLLGLSFLMGPITMLKLYGVPYWVFVIWLDSVTYLHHHGHEEKLPWYRGKEWSYLRGGLTTIDRDYGLFNNIHHDIGTHVIHHLFPQIPHYHLVEATEAAKPILGMYYREPRKSGALPIHLLGSLIESMKQDHFVSDVGDVVFYETDDREITKRKESSP